MHQPKFAFPQYGTGRAAAIVAGVALLLCLAGCGSSSSSTSSAGGAAATSSTGGATATQASAKQAVLGYSAPFLTDVGQVVIQNSVLAAAKAAHMKILQPTNANNDAGQQCSQIHTLVSEGANVIITGPVDTKAIVPCIQFAATQHVPVITTDKAPTGAKVAMIVRANNLLMGKLDCEAVGKALHGAGTVLSLDGAQTDINGLQRTQGFVNCMSSTFPKIHVLQAPTNWEAAQAASSAQTELAAHPEIKAVYMQSDSVMLAGVESVMKSQHKWWPIGDPRHIFTVTIDGTTPVLQAIRQHYVDQTVSQPLITYGQAGVAYAQQAVAGKTFTPGPGLYGGTVVYLEGSPEDQLPSPVVTIGNVNDSSLWGNQVGK